MRVLSWLRSRTLVLAGMFVLAALSLQRFPPVERATELLFLPSTWAREILRPFGWLAVREVRAALEEAAAALPAERAASRALLEAQIDAAMARDPRLRVGRAFLVAEVLEHVSGDTDLVRVRFPRGAGVEPDMPVVCGDAYVGRVREVDPLRPGEGIVQLVTDESSRVGAAVHDGAEIPARMIVGGLVVARARRPGVLSLGARFEDRPVASGVVVVAEVGTGPRAERRAFADGFRLGDLRQLFDRGRPILGVDTAFDFADGLSAVAILGGPELATAGPLAADDAFDDSLWATARIPLAGDSSPTRRTRHLVLPAGARIDAGAALGLGARFFGRVVRVDGRRATAALLGDPELTFSAVAVRAAEDGSPLASVPLHLGRLRSLGLDADGAVLATWSAREGAAAPPLGTVRIATSSGDRGVPAGLWVGTTTLPDGAGEHVLRIVPLQDPAELLRVRVRIATTPALELP
jgi:hypothetical protein